MGRRGVRKYFTRPRKGFRSYGSAKRWNGEPLPSKLLLENAPLEDISKVQNDNPSASECQGFKGFDCVPLPESVGPFVSTIQKKRIRVLSLFDGIASGLHILHSVLRLEVDKYFSCEIDSSAIRVQQHNFKDKIIMLGCVKNLQHKELQDLGQIDLLIGGSPCSDLSLVNWRRKGLHDKHGSGVLFQEFVRVLKFLQEKSNKNGTHLYWLFENTSALETETLQEMSQELGCHPVQRCASQYVPMKRKRNFWGNVDGLYGSKTSHQSDLTLQHFLKPHRTAAFPRVPTLTSNISSQRCGPSKLPPLLYDGKEEFLAVNEMEALFGFPEHFTDCDNLSVTQRRKLLGKSWCIPVLADIMQPLQEVFKLQVATDSLKFSSL